MSKNKEEILDAISSMNIDYTDFTHELEDSHITYAKCKKTIETDNFNIELEVEERVRWSSYDDYEFENLEILDFKVFDENGEIKTKITDEEIINQINY